MSPKTALLVGCGNISKTWLEALQQVSEVKLVGLVDLIEGQAQQRAKEFNLDLPIGTHLQTMLQRTRPDIVFDCTVPEVHYEVTIQALNFGCHVLGEKPMAANMNEAKKMVSAAIRSGKLYAVMQNRRFHSGIRKLISLLRNGVIGKLTSIHADFFIGAHFGGFREKMQNVLLRDMAIHTFDAARFLTCSDPVAVYCHEWNPEGSWYDHGSSAVAIFEMTDNIVFSYRGSWVAEGFRTSWNSKWRIIGEKGSILWDGENEIAGEVVISTPGLLSEYRPISIPLTNENEKVLEGHVGVISDFVQALQTGKMPETICTDNIKSLSMVFGAIDSTISKKRTLIERL